MQPALCLREPILEKVVYVKSGRPSKIEDRVKLVHVGFKADADTVEAIKKLVAAASLPGVVAPKSEAIRRALIEAAGRLPTGSRKNG